MRGGGALAGRVNVKPSVATITRAAAAAPAHGFIQTGRGAAGVGTGAALPCTGGFAGGAANGVAEAAAAGAATGEVEMEAGGAAAARRRGGTPGVPARSAPASTGTGVTGTGVTGTGGGAIATGVGTVAAGAAAGAGGATAAGTGIAAGAGAGTGVATVKGAGVGLTANGTGTGGAAACGSDVRSASTAAAYLVRNERSDARSASGLAWLSAISRSFFAPIAETNECRGSSCSALRIQARSRTGIGSDSPDSSRVIAESTTSLIFAGYSSTTRRRPSTSARATAPTCVTSANRSKRGRPNVCGTAIPSSRQ